MEQFKLDGIVWDDSTSYSRDDKVRTPTSWEAKLGDVNIIITNDHARFRSKWIFHCQALGFDTTYLPNTNSKEEAAEQALKVCRQKVKALYSAFFSA